MNIFPGGGIGFILLTKIGGFRVLFGLKIENRASRIEKKKINNQTGEGKYRNKYNWSFEGRRTFFLFFQKEKKVEEEEEEGKEGKGSGLGEPSDR